FTGDAHQAAHALDHEIVARSAGIRTSLTEARDRAIHDARVDRLDAVVIEPVFAQPPNLEVLDEDVALARERTHGFRAFLGGDVERDGFLVPIRTDVIRGFGRVLAFRVLHIGRPPAASVVAGAGPFDLYDFCPQIGKILGAPGTGEHASEIKNANAGQGCGTV